MGFFSASAAVWSWPWFVQQVPELEQRLCRWEFGLFTKIDLEAEEIEVNSVYGQ